MKKSFIDIIIKILLTITILLALAGYAYDGFQIPRYLNIFYKQSIIVFILTTVISLIYLAYNRKLFNISKVVDYKIQIDLKELNKIILQNEFNIYNNDNYIKKIKNNELIIISMHKNNLNLNDQNKLYEECLNKYNNTTNISSILLYIKDKKDKEFTKNITFKENERINTLICGITLEDNMFYMIEKNNCKNYLKYSELKKLIENLLKIEK